MKLKILTMVALSLLVIACKRNMKNVYLLTFTLILLLSCQKENPCGTYTSKEFNYPLKDSTKLTFPYKGFEVLQFIGNNNDTLILTGKKLENQLVYATINKSGIPHCPEYDTHIYENLSIEFTSNSPKIKSFVMQFYTGVKNNIGSEKAMFVLNNKTFLYPYVDFINNESRYTENLYINGKNYIGLKFSIDDFGNKILYNKNYGILQFFLIDSSTYTLNLK
jgi:hypothetical protein